MREDEEEVAFTSIAAPLVPGAPLPRENLEPASLSLINRLGNKVEVAFFPFGTSMSSECIQGPVLGRSGAPPQQGGRNARRYQRRRSRFSCGQVLGVGGSGGGHSSTNNTWHPLGHPWARRSTPP